MPQEVGNVILVEDNTDLVEKMMKSAILVALEEIGLAAEKFAKDNISRPKPHKTSPTPRPNIVTGLLRNRTTHAVSDGENAVYVGTNVPYAPYIELGTSRADAFPFLRPAAQEHGDFYREILKKHLENA